MVGETGFEPASPLDPNQVRYQAALLAELLLVATGANITYLLRHRQTIFKNT